MIDDAALVAAILAAGYTSDQIGQIADALGASYAAVAQPGATRDEEARGLVEFARRHDLAGELAALILDTAAEKKAVQNYLFGADRGSKMETRPDLDRQVTQQQRQIDRLTDRADTQDRRIDAQDRRIDAQDRTIETHDRRMNAIELIQASTSTRPAQPAPATAGDRVIMAMAAIVAFGMLLFNIWQMSTR